MTVGLGKKLLRGSLVTLCVKVAAALLSFVMFIVIARGMTPEDFSLFGFGFSAATMLVLAGSLGQRVLAVKFIPIYLERSDRPTRLAFTRRGFGLVIAGTGVLGAGFCVVSWLSPALTGGMYAFGVSVFALALALAEYQAHVLRGHGLTALALAPREVVWRALVVAVFAVPAFGWGDPISVQSGLFLMAVMLLGLALIQGHLHPDTRIPALATAGPDCAPDQGEWNRAARVFWGTSVLRAATPNMAVLIVGVMMAVTETGAYFAAFRLAMLVNLVVIAANMLAMPMLSRAKERANLDETRMICRTVVLFTSFPAVVFFLGFVFAGGQALSLYDATFKSAQPALVVIAAGYLIKVLCGPGAAVLQMMGQEARYLQMSLWINGVTLAALVPLVLAFGITGAAMATGTELAATGLAAAWLSRKTIGFDPSILTVFKRTSEV